ncbi:hypothetical protein EQ500_14130 [Lactobacillus sp. XV13L]|nr:hypothetical protein [Lactobacillus sp. XV13L]
MTPTTNQETTTTQVIAEAQNGQLSLFNEPQPNPYDGLLQQLKAANLLKMTPLESMNLLAKLQDELAQKGG